MAARTLAAHRQALEDQILAILTDDDLPVGTGDICRRLGPQPRVETVRCACGHTHEHAARSRILWNSEIVSLLRRLERKGDVEKFPVPRGALNPQGAHYWRSTHAGRPA